jgi:hypothetical protein
VTVFAACVGCAQCDGGSGACTSACYPGYVKNTQTGACTGRLNKCVHIVETIGLNLFIFDLTLTNSVFCFRQRACPIVPVALSAVFPNVTRVPQPIRGPVLSVCVSADTPHLISCLHLDFPRFIGCKESCDFLQQIIKC